jgi:hypothetical protein
VRSGCAKCLPSRFNPEPTVDRLSAFRTTMGALEAWLPSIAALD